MLPIVTPKRVLFLCTGNSARSQIAEALLNTKARGRFVAASAGTKPAPRVNPFAIEILKRAGIDWTGHTPKGIEAIEPEQWDFVITVCDNAKESCPVLPGASITAHWGMEDPADVAGTDAEKLRAFAATEQQLGRRIDLFLALPIEKLERLALQRGVRAIGDAV